MEKRKLVSKYYRLKMSDALRQMVFGIPVSDLVETQVGDHIYLGQGVVKTGVLGHPAAVRVWVGEDGIRARVKSDPAGLLVDMPFGTENEQRQFMDSVREAVKKLLN